MIGLLLTHLVLFSAPGAARTFEHAYVHRLIRARTRAEATRLSHRFAEMEVAQLGCRLQLDRGLAPLACYDVIAFEREWDVGTRASRRATEIGLDHRCARAAATLNVPAATGSLRHVSAACAGRVREVRGIQAYRRDDAGWSGD